MTNFHVSRADGMVRQCNAKSPETCTADTPSEIKEHFANKADAEKAYEKVMEESAQPQKLTKLREDKFAQKRAEIVNLEDSITTKQKSDGATDEEEFQKLQKAKRELRIAERDNAKRDKDTAAHEEIVLKNMDKLERTNYVIENIDSYDGLSGGKAATLANETQHASKIAKEIFESANTIQESKNLFSKDQLNQHKENYTNQLDLEEKAIKARKRDLNRRYGFFKRRNDYDSKLVYNDNMEQLNKRQQEIEEEKRTNNLL